MKKTITYILIGLFLPSLSIQAQSWTQIGNDIDREAASDHSGCSVSISSDGSIVAIGAKENDGNGAESGHVRIYENQNGNWVQIGSDIDGEAAGDISGYSVSLSSDGSIVAIGAPYNYGNGSISGHVRIFENQSGDWVQIGSDIDGEAANDISGYSVSLSSDGSIVAIGAIQNDGNGENAGHVRIYETQSGDWVQIGSDIDGEASDDNSGRSVSLNSDGTIVAIGARRNDGNGTDAGHVRIYQTQSGDWVQIGSDIDGEAYGDNSGYSVSLSSDGSIVAIGAPFNDGNGGISGHVRIFENQSGNWVQIGSDIDGELHGDWSGFFVSLSSDGSILAIGAPENDGNGSFSGHVRIFKNQSGSWVQIGSDIDGEAANDRSGYSICLSSNGSTVVIGAPESGYDTYDGNVRVFYNASLNVSVLQPKGISISIYPNPTNGIINFEFEGKNIQKLMISDITGKQILEKINVQKNTAIDLLVLNTGIYIINIQTEKEIFTSKIIKR